MHSYIRAVIYAAGSASSAPRSGPRPFPSSITVPVSVATVAAAAFSLLPLLLVEVAARGWGARPAQRQPIPELLEQHHCHRRGPVGDFQVPLDVHNVGLFLLWVVPGEDV